jgi:hypothetical protein
MELSLKLDDKGHAVLDDGKPVYVDQEGNDVPLDATALYVKIAELSTEAKNHRKAKADLKTELDGIRGIFEGVEDISEWKKIADKNAQTVENFSQKDLVESKKVEEIKKAQQAAFDAEKDNLLRSFSEKENEFQTTLSTKDSIIYNLTVSSEFARSPWFTGDNSKTILTPEIAQSYFGGFFKVEEDGKHPDGTPKTRVTGYVGDNPIYTKKPLKAGELADFDEAMGVIIENYPMKDRILRSSGGGSGAGGGAGGGGGGGKGTLEAKYAEMQDAHKLAMTEGRSKDAIVLKNRLFELKKKIDAKNQR